LAIKSGEVITLKRALPILVIALLCRCGPGVPEEVASNFKSLPKTIDYNFHVKPILADKCYACHGPDENTRQADLRLDIEKAAFGQLPSGHQAVVKNSVGKSALFHRIISNDPETLMPPPDSKLSLNEREKAILIKWIEQGAQWKPHWSFIPVKRPPVPDQVEGWQSNNPIDRFIQESLPQQGLKPSKQAAKERLLRRVTMDLTGLPPTLEEIDGFVNDHTDHAYEKVVDRLLNSPAHAERLTMEWLDVARYSDTHGGSFDGFRKSWPWRDWVIEAFQKNMPYDQFVTEQIAGDLLEKPTNQQKLATSFLRMGQLEGGFGSLPEEFRVEAVLERTALVGKAFLGLTIECARCHDHKFDPISQKEFYQLSAFFNNTVEMGLGPLDGERAPTMFLYDSVEVELLDSLNQEIDMLSKEYQQLLRDFLNHKNSLAIPEESLFTGVHTYSFEKKRKTEKKLSDDTLEDVFILDNNQKVEASEGVTLVNGHSGNAAYFDDEYDQIALNETGLFDTYQPFSAAAWIKTNRTEAGPTQTIMGNSNNYAGDYRGWDMYLDSTRQLRVRLIHRLPDDYIEVVAPIGIEGNCWYHVGMSYDGSGSASGIKLFINGQPKKTRTLHDQLSRSILPVSDWTLTPYPYPLRVGRSYRYWTFDVGLFEGAIDELSLVARQLSSIEMARLAKVKCKPTESQKLEHKKLTNQEIQKKYTELLAVKTSQKNILDSVQQVMVMEEMPHPRPTFLLERGIYNQHGEQVAPGTPTRVMAFEQEFEKNRLGLAGWITDAKNPLTARVVVNRYWQMIFGKGLVQTPDDFGVQGALPTHPQLLDWLAAEFLQAGWNLRHLLKLMVMSNTYRQSSFASEDAREKDPQNKFYARGSSYRWPAEFIRNNALAASGLLVKKIGGPPVKTYQPEGLWTEPEFNSYLASSYKKDTLEALYRRSLYVFNRRFVPPPFMTTFDAVTRDFCEVRRKQTNSPLQALALLNEPQLVEATRILAERVLNSQEGPEKQIKLAYQLSTGVQPTERQLSLLTKFYGQSRDYFSIDQAAADSLLSIGDRPVDISLENDQVAAMAMVASTIFNFDEFYMKR